MDQLKLIYSFQPVRLAFKFSVCLLVTKMCGDFFYYAFCGLGVTFPRFTVSQQGAQHPLNPPVLQPYPVELQARHLNQTHKFNQYHLNMVNTITLRKYEWQKIYKNKPERENPNQIDQFMQVCEASRILDGIYSKVLRKMKDSGVDIPEGINQKIRQLSQFHLDKTNCKVLPLL